MLVGLVIAVALGWVVVSGPAEGDGAAAATTMLAVAPFGLAFPLRGKFARLGAMWAAAVVVVVSDRLWSWLPSPFADPVYYSLLAIAALGAAVLAGAVVTLGRDEGLSVPGLLLTTAGVFVLAEPYIHFFLRQDAVAAFAVLLGLRLHLARPPLPVFGWWRPQPRDVLARQHVSDAVLALAVGLAGLPELLFADPSRGERVVALMFIVLAGGGLFAPLAHALVRGERMRRRATAWLLRLAGLLFACAAYAPFLFAYYKDDGTATIGFAAGFGTAGLVLVALAFHRGPKQAQPEPARRLPDRPRPTAFPRRGLPPPTLVVSARSLLPREEPPEPETAEPVSGTLIAAALDDLARSGERVYRLLPR